MSRDEQGGRAEVDPPTKPPKSDSARGNRLRHPEHALHTLSLRQNVTQADICRLTGLGRDLMSRYFRSMILPDAISLTKLARAL